VSSPELAPAESHWGLWLHAVRPLPELAVLARAAEDLGAGAILVADEGTDRDLFVTMAVVAQHTRTALLIAAVTNPFSRHPVATAAAFASLAEVAPGRIVAGYGAGGSRVLGPMGFEPARPFSALRETVEVSDALLAGKVVDHDGEFRVRGASLPWSPGPLPVAIAGRGPRAERLAIERAEWVVLAGKPLDTMGTFADGLRTASVAARGRPAALAWNPAAAWSPATVAEMRAHFAYMTVDLPPADRRALGADDDLVARLRAVVATQGPEAAAALVPQAVVDHYAVVGERASVVTRLAELRERVRPEVMVFDANDYSLRHLEAVAALAHDAGVIAGPLPAPATTPHREEPS
jgi:5,10-methylenetetrahydromethanopterin reductase